MIAKRYPYSLALGVAFEVCNMLQPFVERVEIAGSVRREKPEVKDVEILAVPRTTEYRDMFGGSGKTHDHLHEAMTSWCGDGSIFRKRPNIRGHFTFGPKNKYLIHVATGIPIDLFTVPARNWGMAMVIRTGPKEFNIAMMSEFKRKGMAGHAYGGVSRLGHQGREEIDCPDEDTVFDLLGWSFIHPTQRHMTGSKR